MAGEKELIQSLENLEHTIDILIGNRKHYRLGAHQTDRQWLVQTDAAINNNLQAIGISFSMVEGSAGSGWEGEDTLRFGARYLRIQSGELKIGVQWGNFFKRTLISTSKEDIFQFRPFVRKYQELTEKNYQNFIHIIDSVNAEVAQHFRVEKGLKDGLDNLINSTTQKYLDYVELDNSLPEKNITTRSHKI